MKPRRRKQRQKRAGLERYFCWRNVFDSPRSMVTIRTVTWVDAPVERCFRLATSVDFQLAASKNKNVRAVADIRSGSLDQGDTITWRGPMFGLGQVHTNRVEVFRP